MLQLALCFVTVCIAAMALAYEEILMTIYNRSSQTAEVLNARETAPGFTTQDMFHGNGTPSTKSPLAVAVPGYFAGYWEDRRR